jgi:hypothetical protein
MVPNKPDREVIKEHTIAGMNAAKKASFAARSAGGISPPAAYRTVRKSLDLHGSSQLFSRNLTITGLRGKMIALLDFSIGEDFL